jgi:hypothetical protein
MVSSSDKPSKTALPREAIILESGNYKNDWFTIEGSMQ